MVQKELHSQCHNKEAWEMQSKMLVTHETEYKITCSSTKIPLLILACGNYEGCNSIKLKKPMYNTSTNEQTDIRMRADI